MSIVISDKTATITSDGYRRYFYVPANVKSGTIQYNMVGAGGGGGGSDYPYGGGDGSAGGIVTGTLSVNSGDLVEVVVAGGGSRGQSGRGSALGGAGGLSFVEYSGGPGGNAGPSGSSGAGAGGGGATILKVNGIPKAIAAGGAGGGGGGHWGGGQGKSGTIIESKYNQTDATYYTPITNGAYCLFLNTYGVDIGYGNTNVTYQWDVYFPLTQNYNFYVSGDNEADILVDGVQVATTGGWGGGGGPFKNIFSGTISVSVGLHSVTINGRNYGGPGSVGGQITGQTEIWNSRNARKSNFSTAGAKGENNPGDGGGGGGGGGGYLGGGGGYQPGGDLGGGAGYIGKSYAEGGTTLAQLTNKQANYTIYGTGGTAASPSYSGSDGEGGIAAITINLITRNLHHNVNGVWKATNNAYVKKNGVWKSCSEIWVKDNGIWKRSLLKTDPTITWYADTVGIGRSEPTAYIPPPVTVDNGGEQETGTTTITQTITETDNGDQSTDAVAATVDGKPGEDAMSNAGAFPGLSVTTSTVTAETPADETATPDDAPADDAPSDAAPADDAPADDADAADADATAADAADAADSASADSSADSSSADSSSSDSSSSDSGAAAGDTGDTGDAGDAGDAGDGGDGGDGG
jgi:hypothetical protein